MIRFLAGCALGAVGGVYFLVRWLDRPLPSTSGEPRYVTFTWPESDAPLT